MESLRSIAEKPAGKHELINPKIDPASPEEAQFGLMDA